MPSDDDNSVLQPPRSAEEIIAHVRETGQLSADAAVCLLTAGILVLCAGVEKPLIIEVVLHGLGAQLIVEEDGVRIAGCSHCFGFGDGTPGPTEEVH